MVRFKRSGYHQMPHFRRSKKGKNFSAGRGQKKFNYFSSRPFRSTKNWVHLPIEASVYVPSTIRDESISKKSFHQRIANTQKSLSNFFGGYSSYDIKGGYTNNEGKLVKEPIAKVTSFASKDDYEEKQSKFRRWLARKPVQWKQDDVSYEYEGDLYFVRGKKKR